MARVETHFQWAERLGLRCIAVTDHHVMDNMGDVQQAATDHPDVRYILGAELSVDTSVGAVDLVCLGLPPKAPAALSRILDEYHQWQRAYGAAFSRGVQLLGHDYGDDVRLELLRSYRPRHVIEIQGATHVRNATQKGFFLQRGWLKSSEEYGEFCEQVQEVAALPPYPAARDVVPVVHDAGGIVSIAHPTNYFLRGDRERMDALREELAFDAVECAHRSVPPELTSVFRNYCVEHGLLSTAGSDCHLDEHVGRQLARHIGKDDWLNELLERCPA